MICNLRYGSYAKVDSFESAVQEISATTFDRSRWATQ